MDQRGASILHGVIIACLLLYGLGTLSVIAGNGAPVTGWKGDPGEPTYIITLDYSTYLGGAGVDRALSVDVNDGFAFVAGYTQSAAFPILSPYQSSLNDTAAPTDAFISKFSTSGSLLIFSTYLGGSDADYATGSTTSRSMASMRSTWLVTLVPPTCPS